MSSSRLPSSSPPDHRQMPSGPTLPSSSTSSSLSSSTARPPPPQHQPPPRSLHPPPPSSDLPLSMQSDSVNPRGWNDPTPDVFTRAPNSSSSIRRFRRSGSGTSRGGSASSSPIIPAPTTFGQAAGRSLVHAQASHSTADQTASNLATKSSVAATESPPWDPQVWTDALNSLLSQLQQKESCPNRDDITGRVSPLLDPQVLSELQEPVKTQLALFASAVHVGDKSVCLRVTQGLSVGYFDVHGKWIMGLKRLVNSTM